MQIGKAFCAETNSIVDIYEASAKYFEQEKPRKRFSFLCSSKGCREKQVRVSGVNYDKNPKEGDAIQQAMHFRTLDEHADGCVWVELEKELAKLHQNDKDGNVEPSRAKRHYSTKADRIIELFYIKLDDGKTKNNFLSTMEDIEEYVSKIKTLPDSEKAAAIKDLQGNSTKTKRLYELVSCFESMSYDERKEKVLTIKGHTPGTYASLILPIKYYKQENKWKIFYGGAHLKTYKTGYAIQFIDTPSIYIEENKRAPSTSLFIKKDELDKYPKGAFLRSIFDDCGGDSKYYLKCFFIGIVTLDDMGRCNIGLDHLDLLHCILKEKK